MLEDMGVEAAHEVLDDLEAAIERFKGTADPRLQRRALREALGHIYSLRSHLEREQGKDEYRRRGGDHLGYRTVEGLALVRGAMAHDLTAEVGPRMAAFMGAYLTRYLGDGPQALAWLPVARLPEYLRDGRKEGKQVQVGHYVAAVDNRAVVRTLDAALQFLSASTALDAPDEGPLPTR